MLFPGLACIFVLRTVDFDIAGGDAGEKIRQWSNQAHIQVMWEIHAVQGVVVHPVRGTFDPCAALRSMLAGTGITFQPVNDHTAAVFEEQYYCHPELGAAAPLPPCVQRPLRIRPSATRL